MPCTLLPKPQLQPLAGAVAVSTVRVPGWHECLRHKTRPTDLHKPGRKKGELGRRSAKDERCLRESDACTSGPNLSSRCEKLRTGEEVSKIGDFWVVWKFSAPPLSVGFLEKPPQNLHVVSRENFGTWWSLTFSFRLRFLFSLGLIEYFLFRHYHAHSLFWTGGEKCWRKNASPALGFYLPSSEDRPILHTFATTVTSAPPPPEIKTLSQEKQSRTGEDCTSARKLCRQLPKPKTWLPDCQALGSRLWTAMGKSPIFSVPQSPPAQHLCTHPSREGYRATFWRKDEECYTECGLPCEAWAHVQHRVQGRQAQLREHYRSQVLPELSAASRP